MILVFHRRSIDCLCFRCLNAKSKVLLAIVPHWLTRIQLAGNLGFSSCLYYRKCYAVYLVSALSVTRKARLFEEICIPFSYSSIIMHYFMAVSHFCWIFWTRQKNSSFVFDLSMEMRTSYCYFSDWSLRFLHSSCATCWSFCATSEVIFLPRIVFSYFRGIQKYEP